jgi:hypothetical protein
MRIQLHDETYTKTAATCPPLYRGRAQWHLVNVVFGARDRNCAGAGICHAKELPLPREDKENVGCQSNAAFAWVQVSKLRSLAFHFHTLCPRLYQQYFHEDIFRMECDAVLELLVSGQRVRYVIPKGEYPVFRYNGYWVVHIPETVVAAS